MKNNNHKFIRLSLLNNQITGALLILFYCIAYGITAQIVLNGLQLMYFLCSIVFALSTIHIRDQQIQKEKIKKGVLLNQFIGSALVFAYIFVYGITSIAILNGFQLIFFMSSFTFVLTLFYVKDPERIKKEEDISYSNTSNLVVEKFPCFINKEDMSWLIRALNNSLSIIIGFCELLLNRDYSEKEKDYMQRAIYEQALSMSHSINKAVNINPEKSDLKDPRSEAKGLSSK